MQLKWNEAKGSWGGDYTIAGKRYRPDFGTASEVSARKRLHEAYQRDKIEAARKARERPWTVTEAIDAFTAEVLEAKSSALRPKTRKRYLTSLIAIAPHFEHMRLCDVDGSSMFDFEHNRKSVSGRTGAPVESATVLRDFTALSQVFEHAKIRGFVDTNPVLDYVRTRKKAKALKNSQPRTRYLDHSEETRVINAATPEMFRAAIVVAIDTGLRLEELFSRQWIHVDLEEREIRVTADVAKTKRSVRSVPLLPRALQVLKALPRNGPYVFWHDDGERYSEIHSQLDRIVVKSGVDFWWHDLRRTCGCRLLQARGFPLEHVSKWLGHSTTATTERHYAFLRDADLHEAVKRSEGRAGSVVR